MRVVVIGAGISGLATAHAVRALDPRAEVVVLERESRVGGNIVTVREGGFLIDGGPDSWVANKPHATALAKRLGLGDELIGTIPENRRALILWNGALHPLPEGFVLGVPTSVMPIVRTPLFSLRGKVRMALEPFVPRGRGGVDDDESIDSFVRRRLGGEVVERLVGPLLGGVYGGDASQLSMRATLPQFVEMEKTKGSLIRALGASSLGTRSSGEKPSMFTSLAGGLGALIDRLADAVGREAITTGVTAREVAPLPPDDTRGRLAVTVDGAETRYADHVVLAVPGHVAAGLLRGWEGAASLLSEIPYASTGVVAMAFPRAGVPRPLDGTGYIVPRVLGRPALAVTWVSSKWAGRAPDGEVLLRVFLGGKGNDGLVEQDDAALIRLARQELSETMHVDAAPAMARVFRFLRASPQPMVGHLGRMRRLREKLAVAPGVHLVASGYDGVGIPDCVRQAEAAAQAMVGVPARP